MSKRFLVHWVLPTIVLGVVLGLAVKNRDEKKPRSESVRSDDPWGAPTARPSAASQRPMPPEREPRYGTPNEQTPRDAALVSAAMKLVYTRCSSFAHAFREGANLEGNTVFKSEATDPDRVNVRVKLDHSDAAEGNLLPYMVTFDERGTPSKLQATKDIAAKLCELPGRYVDLDLR